MQVVNTPPPEVAIFYCEGTRSNLGLAVDLA
jgi:hypothetical protein